MVVNLKAKRLKWNIQLLYIDDWSSREVVDSWIMMAEIATATTIAATQNSNRISRIKIIMMRTAMTTKLQESLESFCTTHSRSVFSRFFYSPISIDHSVWWFMIGFRIIVFLLFSNLLRPASWLIDSFSHFLGSPAEQKAKNTASSSRLNFRPTILLHFFNHCVSYYIHITTNIELNYIRCWRNPDTTSNKALEQKCRSPSHPN